jgi:hypothetical protein
MKKISKAQPITRYNFIITIFGDAGVGKTTLAMGFPKPILFDFDEGIHRAEQSVRCDHYKMKKYDDFHEYIMGPSSSQEIESEGYKTIIVDTAGTMLDDYMSLYVQGLNRYNKRANGLSQQGWGVMKVMFAQLRARARQLKVDFVFLCHDKNEGDEIVRKVPEISGGSAAILRRASDMIFYMYADSKGTVIDPNTTPEHVGKNIINMKKTLVPKAGTKAFTQFWPAILQSMKDHISLMTPEQLARAKYLEEIEDLLNKADTPQKFDGVVSELKERSAKVPAPVKAEAMAMYQTRIKTLQIKWDSKNKVHDWKQPTG